VAIEVHGNTFKVYHRSVDTTVVLNSGQIRYLAFRWPRRKEISDEARRIVECRKNDYKKGGLCVVTRDLRRLDGKKDILDQTHSGK